MKDVIIIDGDNPQDVAYPLIVNLEEHNISTNHTEIIEANMTQKIRIGSFFVLVLIITEKCIEFFLNLISTVTGANKGNKNYILPILHDIDDELIKQYPLLQEYNYIDYDKNIDRITQEIRATVDKAKEVAMKEELKALGDNLHKLGIKGIEGVVSAIYDMSLLHHLEAFSEAGQELAHHILADIAKKENIYIGETLDNLLASPVMPVNIRTHYQEIQQESGLPLVAALSALCFWYADTYFNVSLIKRKLIVPIKPHELTREDRSEMYLIENLVYPTKIAGTEEDTEIVYAKNSHTISAARDVESGKLIAFICAYPVTAGFYEQIMSGEFDDTSITPHDIETYDQPGTYKLYVSSVCIHPSFNRTSAFGVVYKAFMELMESLADRGVFMEELVADTATKKGALLCRAMGMKKRLSTNHGTSIYTIGLDAQNVEKIFSKNKKLVKKYQGYCRGGRP